MIKCNTMNNQDQGKGCSAILNRVLNVLCLSYGKISGERLQDHWLSGSVYILYIVATWSV